MTPRDMQQSKPAAPENSTPSGTYLKRSIAGFMSWWNRRAFKLAASEPRADMPDAFKDATAQFSSRIWDIALDAASDSFDAERAAIQQQLTEANAKVSAAALARGKAQSAVTQLEKRVLSLEQSLKDSEAKLTAAAARQQELLNDAAAAQQARRDLEQRLADGGKREKDQQSEIATLRRTVDAKAEEAKTLTTRHQEQLAKAKQHYASMESRLAGLLDEYKSARNKL